MALTKRPPDFGTTTMTRGGHNMFGKVRVEVRLTCPPPDDVQARMRDKVRGSAPTQGTVSATDCRGCTPDEAIRIWRTAAEMTRRDRIE